MGAANGILYHARILQHRRFSRKSVAKLLSEGLLKSNLIVSFLFCLSIFVTLRFLISHETEDHILAQHRQVEDWPAGARRKIENEGFSVMINGFHRERIPILKEVIHIYCQVPSVSKIYVTWGATTTAPHAEDFPCRVPVEVVVYPTPDLTNRFIPPNSLKTDAVLICDDDIFVAVEDIQFVFESFKENNDRIVGVFGRDFAEQKDESLVYANDQRSYSIMLTKFLFVHRKYLQVFPQVVPQKTMQYINEISNCEDIALNMVVSKLSGLSPVNVNVTAIDYGDSRAYSKNDAKLEAVRVSALSIRSSHKGQRSECLSNFKADFGENYLRHTSAHISKYAGEQVLCRNGQDWIACGKAGKNNALRKAKGKFAFVTVLADTSPEHAMAANCWAKRLHDLKTPHDIVLVLVLSPGEKYDPEAFPEFSRVRVFKSLRSERAVAKRQFNKFRIWQLTEYEKLVYIDLDTLVVENVDELFDHPDVSAAPDILTGDKFNSGVLVFKPSMDFADMFQRSVEHNTIFSYNKGDQGILNRIHDDWFSQDIRHRLPTKYNFLKMFPDHYNPPDWFDQNTVESFVGPPKIVHFANPWTKPWILPEPGAREEVYGAFWRKACGFKLDEDSSDGKALIPPEDPSILLWEDGQSALAEKRKSKNLRVSQPTVGYSLNTTLSLFQKSKEVYATIYSSTGSSFPNLLVWSQSLRATGTVKKLAVVAPRNTSDDELTLLRVIFDKVHLVEVEAVPSAEQELRLTVELCSLTTYTKVVYFHPATLFIRSVDDLFLHPSVSAVPAAYPPDRMAGKMLVLEPQNDLYRDLKSHVDASEEFPFFTLNNFFFDWNEASVPHRIASGFHAELLYKPNLIKHIHDSRSFWIDSRFTVLGNASLFSRYEHTKMVGALWVDSFCSAAGEKARRHVSIGDVASSSGMLDLHSVCGST